MEKWIAMLTLVALLGGTVGYVVYAKACDMNDGKCCGRCSEEKK